MATSKTPGLMGQRLQDLLQDLGLEKKLADPVDEVECLVHDLTCLVLDWMGSGRRSDLELLLSGLDCGLAEAGVRHSPLKGMSQHDRLIVKVLEIGRFIRVFGKTSTTVRHMSMLRTLRSPKHKKLVMWALAQESPFTSSYAEEDSATYGGQRMNKVLGELVEADWLSKSLPNATNQPPLYAPTWNARLAADLWVELRR